MIATSPASRASDLLLRPMPPALLVPTALIVLVAGAAYCLGYEGLRGGSGQWPPSLLWSACAVWPWLLLFEYVKRRDWAAAAPLAAGMIALLLVGTGALSISLEFLADRLRGAGTAPVGLQLLRRLPAIGATLLLLLLAGRERRAALLRAPLPAGEAEAERLRRQAPAIRWIQAADNYLELHFDGRIGIQRITMREAVMILEPLGFVRIHRSFIVNRNHVEAVVSEAGRRFVRIAGGTLLPAGRAFSGNLRGLR